MEESVIYTTITVFLAEHTMDEEGARASEPDRATEVDVSAWHGLYDDIALEKTSSSATGVANTPEEQRR